MHENVRLRVERNRHSWSYPVKHLQSRGAERVREPMSNALTKPSGLEPPFRIPKQSRPDLSSHFERSGGAERARAAVPSAAAETSGPRSSKSRQVRCFRNRVKPAELVRPWSLWSSKAPCGNFELNFNSQIIQLTID